MLSLKYLLTIVLGILLSFDLPAQLSALHPPEALLPVDIQHGYFDSQRKNTPPGDLKKLMLQRDFKVAERENTNTSLMYRPHLAFFCRVEVKIDQAVGTPFRFRLGSVDYVDYLEGKRDKNW